MIISPMPYAQYSWLAGQLSLEFIIELIMPMLHCYIPAVLQCFGCADNAADQILSRLGCQQASNFNC